MSPASNNSDTATKMATAATCGVLRVGWITLSGLGSSPWRDMPYTSREPITKLINAVLATEKIVTTV